MSPIIDLKFHHITATTVRGILSDWPARSRHLAYELMATYQLPHEATPNMLIWYYNGAWKRTVLHREGVGHNIPHPHIDILEQTVDERVPIEISSELSRFDGSIIVDRTRGEMTAYCESERANIFLLNLAHDIIIERKTAKEAREVLLMSSDSFHLRLPNEYRDSLLFSSRPDISDPNGG